MYGSPERARRRQHPRLHGRPAARRPPAGAGPADGHARHPRGRVRAGRRVRFRPGQWIELHVPHPAVDGRGSRRVFSLATPPGRADGVAVAFRVTGTLSSFKRALSALPEGGLVRATGVGGDFVLPRDAGVPLLLLAGGIGITPFVSQLADLARSGAQRDVVVVLLLGPGEEVPYADVLLDSGARVVVVSPERPPAMPAPWAFASGPTIDVATLRRPCPTPPDGSRTSPGDRAWWSTRAASCAARASAASARTRSPATERGGSSGRRSPVRRMLDARRVRARVRPRRRRGRRCARRSRTSCSPPRCRRRAARGACRGRGRGPAPGRGSRR